MHSHNKRSYAETKKADSSGSMPPEKRAKTVMSEIEELRKNLEKSQKENKELLASKKIIEAQLQAKLQATHKENAGLKYLNAGLQEAYASLRSENTSLWRENTALQEQLKRKAEGVVLLEAAYRKAETNLKQSENSFDEVVAYAYKKISSLQREIMAQQNAYEHVQRELSQKLQLKQQENEQLLQENTGLKQEKENEKFKQENARVLEETKQENNLLWGYNIKLQQKVAELQQQVAGPQQNNKIAPPASTSTTHHSQARLSSSSAAIFNNTGNKHNNGGNNQLSQRHRSFLNEEIHRRCPK